MRQLTKARLLTGGLLALAVLVGAGPAAYGGITGPGTGPPPSTVDWKDCPEADAPSTQCGTMLVPVDWARPRGERITVAVARRPADDPAHRIGTLFFNPGGPGDSEAKYVRNADWYFSATLRARFDIVGLDPRATGDSAAVTCGDVPAMTPDDTVFPKSEREFQAMVSHNRALGLSCLRKTGSLMAHTDVISVARDHEALRAALGVEQVTWLGISYGAQLAANYAELFPRRTRAMVLDAALEHSIPELAQVTDETMAAEASFNRFITWCATDATCALRGQDVGAVFDRLVAGAEAHPIPVEGALRPVNGEDIRMGAMNMLVMKEPGIFGPDLSWAGLSRALAAAVDGNASAFMLAPAGVVLDGQLSRLAIACMEYVPQISTYAQMRQRIQLGRQLAPHLQGASMTWQINRCIGWPVPVANPPRTLRVRGVPTLMVHAVFDSSDSYRWAHSMASQIEGSAMLTRTGDGHTSYHTSECARVATDEYLVRPQAPADRVCVD
jgi:pimeloyl-ACP methyl ester carboxylesterase